MTKKHIFLSYCHDNRTAVSRLHLDLIEKGFKVWWDREILPGEDWKHEIREAMRGAYAVVVCLSNEISARHTTGVYPELQDAITALREHQPGSIFLILVKLSPCEIPRFEIDGTRTLDRIQSIDLYPEEDYSDALARVVRALQKAKPALNPVAPRTPPGPEAPKTGDQQSLPENANTLDDVRSAEEIDEEQTEEAGRSLDDLFILLKTQLRDEWLRIRDGLTDAAEHFADLSRYKRLHDCFHCIDLNRILERTSEVNELEARHGGIVGNGLSPAEQVWFTLKVETERFDLRDVRTLLDLAKQAFKCGEVRWTVRLASSSKELRTSAADKNLKRVLIATESLNEILGRVPSDVNTQLVKV